VEPTRRQVAEWVEQYLARDLSFDQLFALLPEVQADRDVAELVDLVEHEPKQGGVLGATADEHARHMRSIRELIGRLRAS
jgi:hypothetical protein